MTTPATTTPNLRESRKAQSAAKKAPAKKAAPKATEKAAVTKLRWQLTGERTPKGVESIATNGDREYTITGADDSWKAVVKVGRKTTVLSEGTFAKAYAACVQHNRQRQSA